MFLPPTFVEAEHKVVEDHSCQLRPAILVGVAGGIPAKP